MFSHKVRFIYHADHFNTQKYWNALLANLSKAGSAYAPAVNALIARGGIAPLSHFPILSGSPNLQKRHIPAGEILKRLTGIKLLVVVDVEGIGPCVQINRLATDLISTDAELRSRLITEKVLLLAVKNWARKLGLASYDKIQVRGDTSRNPAVGTFSWDLSGPCYLSPMARYDSKKKLQPGFLVCDVIVAGREIGEPAVAAFVRKVQMTKHLRNLAPVLPMLVADQFALEAFRLGRAHGVLMGTPATLFGDEVARGIATLLKVLNNAGAVAATNPEAITEIFSKLAAIEGAAGNLRGPLFELIVGHCVKVVEEGSIEIGYIVRNSSNGQRAEIDVLRRRAVGDVYAYECKGYHAGNKVKLVEVEKWAKEKVPLIYSTLRPQDYYKNSNFHFEFWTTSSFDDDAMAFLQNHAKKTRKYGLGWKDGSSVRQYAARLPSNSMVKVLDEHYFNHPLARLNNKYDAAANLGNFTNDTDIIINVDEINFDAPLPDLTSSVE
ncbi:hypothetical protein [Methylorubrum sp. SL192]|uniref:hypothetical protein n=1 Tax=Methylorubrum sp. SL192 TaxID=2995167 RepID=UPI0022737D02|nr:hypothetical protein [Methylorubrum sp. SL192]MCY1640686.1 hypothetical protein [Methylorubrum sp. SL192]